MELGIAYCTAYKEDSAFGTIHDAFSYRLTGSCIANPEYDPGDMRKAILIHRHYDATFGSHDAPGLRRYPLVLCNDP